MVEALLDATAAMLAERGLDHTTTNHIAKKAGVSIGSLYQYFPDKEALIEALLERMGREASRRFREQATRVDMNQVPLPLVAETAIRYGLRMLSREPLVAELVKNWHRLPVHQALDPVEQLFMVMAQPYFLRNYRGYPVQHLETKLFVLINSVIFTILRYLYQQPQVLREDDLVRALVDMIVGLLSVPDSGAESKATFG